MKDIREFEGMTGLEDIVKQIEVCKTFAIDHRARRGMHTEILNRYHPKQIAFKVAKIQEKTKTSKTFRLSPVEGYVPPFQPGQYINVNMEIDGIRTSRAYTLSSPVTQRSFYEITVKKSPNGFGSEYMLNQVKEGDMLTASGPAGNFYRVPCVYGKRLVFVAGGSGITPFISMLQTDYEKGDSSFDIDVLYGCSDEDDIMFKETLDALADKGMCRVHYIISNPGENCPYETGFVTEELIRKLIPDIENCTFYLCGPSVMYRFVTGELEKMGVPRRRIRKEVEVPPKNPTGFAGWPAGIDQNTFYTITLKGGQQLEACATDTILHTLELNHVVVPSLCRSGECSTCRAKLVSGKVFHPGNELLRKSDMAMGYIHPCVTYPIEDITLSI